MGGKIYLDNKPDPVTYILFAWDTAIESQLETVIELFQDAVDFWKGVGRAMLVLLSGEQAPSGIKKL